MIPAEIKEASWPVEPGQLNFGVGGQLECQVKGVGVTEVNLKSALGISESEDDEEEISRHAEVGGTVWGKRGGFKV